MDPQSAAFLPRDELWTIASEMSRLQQIQSEHAERLSRVERRQDEDIGRTKSLWGSQSPFPGILAGTPQQRPMEQPPADAFSGFDDPANLIGSLQLDAEDEPRRVGATSRANSVRFDETANQGHWAHPSRVSLDLLPRSGSSLGSHPLIERTYSHKSDGRQSSAGQSVHSATSRANSLGIDTLSAVGTSDGQPIVPGLFVLGTCPAIIRCWLTTNFKHDSLLYAAVCTGSHVSSLSADLVTSLGFDDQVRQNNDGISIVNLTLYLPEATLRTPSSRVGLSTAQIPCITVEFQVTTSQDESDRGIRIIVGSDVLRKHSGDVLFSTNVLLIYDDEHAKLSVPLVRPEMEAVYSSLQTKAANGAAVHSETPKANGLVELQGLRQEEGKLTAPAKEASQSTSPAETPLLSSTTETHASVDSIEAPSSPAGRSSPSIKSGPTASSWNSWRRDAEKPPSSTESSWGKTNSSYQRREQGIKVLRPLKAATRSTSNTRSATIASTQSRFFEDGKRRTSSNVVEPEPPKKSISGLAASTLAKETPLTRTTSNGNPVGGASAFSWLSK